MASPYDALLDESASGSPYDALLQDEEGEPQVGRGNPYDILLQPEQKPKSLTPATDQAWETGAAVLPNPDDPYAQMGSSGPSASEIDQMISRSPAAQATDRILGRAGTEWTKMWKEVQGQAGAAAGLGYEYLPTPATGFVPGRVWEMLPERTGIPAISRGVRGGLEATARGLTSQENVAILAGLALMPEVELPLLGIGAKQALSAAFAAQMATQYPQLWKEFKEAPDLQSKSAVLTNAVVNTVMLGMAGKHAIVGEEMPVNVPGLPPQPQPQNIPRPPIQSQAFMLPPPQTTTPQEAGIVTSPATGEFVRAPVARTQVTSGGEDWRAVQDRFQQLTAEADWLERQRRAFPANPVILNRIDAINAELRTLGEPQRGFTAEVTPVQTQEELQAERERAQLAADRGGPEPIEAVLGGEENAEQSSDAQVEARAATQRQQAGAGGEEVPAGGGDYAVGAEEGAAAGGPVSPRAPIPGQIDKPEDYVPGAPTFDQFYRSKSFQPGWTKERRISEYNRLYHRGSPENAALLTPDQFQRAAGGSLAGLVADSEGQWDNAAYNAIDDAYLKGKPINAELWHDIRESPAPIGYTREGDFYEPDLRMKYSRAPDTGVLHSLSDETRAAFEALDREDETPNFGAMVRRFILKYGKAVEQVALPSVSSPRGRLLPEGVRGEVDRVEQAAKAYGARVAWFRGVDAPVYRNMGSQYKDTIFLNIDMAGGEPIHQVFGHELTHFLERNHPDIYNRLGYEILRSTRNKWMETPYGEHLKRTYDPKEWHHELIADFMGEAVRDPRKFQQLMGRDPGLMARFRDAFNDFIDWSKAKFRGISPLSKEISPMTASSVMGELNRTRRNAMAIFREAYRGEGAGRGGEFREAMGKGEPGYEAYRREYDRMLKEGHPDYTVDQPVVPARGSGSFGGGKQLNMLGSVKMAAQMTRYHFDTFAKAGRNPGVGADMYRGHDRITAIEQALSKGANFADIAYHYKNKFGEDGYRQFVRDAKEFVVQELAKPPDLRLLGREVVTPEDVRERAKYTEAMRQVDIKRGQERQATKQKAWEEEFRHTLKGNLQVKGRIGTIGPNQIVDAVIEHSKNYGYEGTPKAMVAGGERAAVERGMRTWGLRPEGAIEGHYAVFKHASPYGDVIAVRGPFKDATGPQKLIDVVKAGQGVGGLPYKEMGIVEVTGGESPFRFAEEKRPYPDKRAPRTFAEGAPTRAEGMRRMFAEYGEGGRLGPVTPEQTRARETSQRATNDIAKTNIQRVLGGPVSLRTQASMLRRNLPRELRSNNPVTMINNAVGFIRRNLVAGAKAAQNEPWAPEAQAQYKGYNIYSHKLSDQYGYKPETVMLAESGLSPNTSPEQSFEATRRLMKMLRYNSNHRFDNKMMEWAKNAEWTNEKGITSKLYSPWDLRYLKGKRFTDIPDNNTKQAKWMRAFDEVYHRDRRLYTVRSDGELGKLDAQPFAWTTFKMMQNGIDALKGALEPHEILDTAKVSNYYMSKLRAFERSNHVVVDTHHTSLGYGNSLPSSNPLVAKVFASGRGGPNREFGGLYSIFHEATLQAAKEMGMEPKELQALVWAYQRQYKSPVALVSRSAAGKARVTAIQNLWKDAAAGRLTEDEARAKTEEIASQYHGGKIPPPAYYEGPSGQRAKAARVASQPAELPPGGGYRRPAGPRGGGYAPEAAPVEPRAPGAAGAEPAAGEFRESVPKRREQYPNNAAIRMADGTLIERPTHAQATLAAEMRGYTEADLDKATYGYTYPGGRFESLEDFDRGWREARPKGGARQPAQRYPDKRARARDLASDEPFVSRFANRYVSEDVKAGKIGEIAPGQGYSTHDLVQMGMGMTPEQVQASIRRVESGGLDPMIDAMAIRSEAARLSERSTRLSRVAERQPNNRKAKQAADAAFEAVTNFHNGPVAALKNAWHGVGMSMQGEHPVDLSTLNGWKETYMRQGKVITPKVEERLKNGVKRYGKVIDAEQMAKARWERQVDAIGAGKMLPSPESVRNNIMRRLRNEPC